MVPDGCIHGTFQPFHHGHLDLAFAALEQCCFLWIGLCDPLPPSSTSSPLSYHERQFMITRTFVAEGISLEKFSFTPFPLKTPEQLPHFLATETTCFLREGGNDNPAIAPLESQGFPIHLVEGIQNVDETKVQELIRAQDPAWKRLVPMSVAAYLDEIDFASRLAELP